MKQITIEIDPNEVHVDKGASYQKLAMACGVLPLWALASMATGNSMKVQACESYQFPITEMTGGVVDEYGIYNYPEDPPLVPYMKIVNGDETAYFYAHAMVAFVDKEGTYMTRMD